MRQSHKRTGFAAVLTAMALVLAMAVGASAAFATQYNSEGAGSATGTNHEFKDGGATVLCKTGTFAWTQSGTSSIFEVTPTYESCELTAPIKGSAKVTNNGCKYAFGTPTGGPTSYTADVSVLPSSCSIHIETSTIFGPCDLTVAGGGANEGLETADFTNLNTTLGSFEGEVVSKVVKITDTVSGSACSLAGIKSGATGEYIGKVLEKGVIVE